VQKAINRIQGVEDTADVVAEARARGFHSVNLDLMYGLPLQTPAKLARTLDAVMAIRPDRIALYNYAHMPQMFRIQRQIREDMLPPADVKLTLLIEAMERLARDGYQYIGMDHFALPDDELARAARDGTLHRNFQGYATRPDLDLIGLGASSLARSGMPSCRIIVTPRAMRPRSATASSPPTAVATARSTDSTSTPWTLGLRAVQSENPTRRTLRVGTLTMYEE